MCDALSPQDSDLSPLEIEVEEGYGLRGQGFDMAKSFDVLPSYKKSVTVDITGDRSPEIHVM